MPGRTRTYKAILLAIVLAVVAVGAFGVGYYVADPGVATRIKLHFQLKSYYKDIARSVAEDPKLKGVDPERYALEWTSVKTVGLGPIGRYHTMRTYGRNVAGQYVTTNDHGLRSRLSLVEMASQAKANARRGRRNVLLLGSSAAFGEGATDDAHTISGCLSEFLPPERFQVFNLAQGGYVCGTELAMLALVGTYLEPDFVLIMDGFNDAISITYDWPYYKDPRWLPVKDLPGLLNEYATCLGTLARASGGPGRHVFLSLQPLGGFRNDAFLGDTSIKKMWANYPYLLEVVRRVAEQSENASFLDLTSIFQDEKDSSRYFHNNIHMNSEGQRKVAQVMASVVLEQEERYSGPGSSQTRMQMVKNILDTVRPDTYPTAAIPH